MTTRPTFNRSMFQVRTWAARPDGSDFVVDYVVDVSLAPTFPDALAMVNETAPYSLDRAPFIVEVAQVWHDDVDGHAWEGWNEVDGEIIDTYLVSNGSVERRDW